MKSDDAVITRIREVRHQISEEQGHDPRKLVADYVQLQSGIKNDCLSHPRLKTRAASVSKPDSVIYARSRFWHDGRACLGAASQQSRGRSGPRSRRRSCCSNATWERTATPACLPPEPRSTSPSPTNTVSAAFIAHGLTVEVTVDEHGRLELAARVDGTVDISREVVANVDEAIALKDKPPVGNKLVAEGP
jgi:hypothetical protein